MTEKALREGSNRELVGYEDIGAEAFGGLGRATVSSTMYIELLGTCALLFILEVSIPLYLPHASMLSCSHSESLQETTNIKGKTSCNQDLHGVA